MCAHAEIINGKAYSKHTQAGEQVECACVWFQNGRFRNLQFELGGGKAQTVQRTKHHLGKVGIAQLAGSDIDGDHKVMWNRGLP